MRHALPVVILLGVMAGAPALAAPAPERGAGELAVADADPVAMLNRLLLEAQPQGENAWPVYEAALREFVDPRFDTEEGGQEVQGRLADIDIHGRWRHEQRVEAHRIVDAWRGMLDAMARAAEAPGFARQYNGEPNADLAARFAGAPNGFVRVLAIQGNAVVSMRALVAAGEVNSLALRLALDAQDWHVAAVRLRVGLALSRQISLQPTWVEKLFAARIALHHLSLLRVALTEQRMPADALEALLAVLGDARVRRESLDDLVQAHVALQIPVIFHMIEEHGALWPGGQRVMLFRMHRDGWRWVADAEPVERERIAEQMLRATRRSDIDDPKLFVAEDIAAASRLFNTIELVRAELAATRIMLRLEIHFARTGQWPDRLEDVVGEADVFEPVTGEAFRYRLLVGGDAMRPYELRLPERVPRSWALRGEDSLNPARRPGWFE